MPKKRSLDPWILNAALEGLEDRAQQLDAYIVVVQRLLSTSPGKRVAAAGQGGARPKRKVSAAARRCMAAAQKRRWAEYRKKKAGSVKARGKE